MLIKVKAHNVHLQVAQREWIERRLAFAFGRFTARIQQITLTFCDVNGTRGGLDKQCRIRVLLDSQPEVIVEGKDATVEAVVACVVDRAARAVARSVAKMRDYSAPASARP